ncbi:MAG: M20/M25/M40 family metallo-hydrolase [Spirochaetes bacterium]|nr:M20/M25/M40 family metallo-hydrolase [Spirochaetota bacterium]
MTNINKERLINYFLDLVKISSPSWKEGRVVEYIVNVLKDIKADIIKYKCGESNNLLVRLYGNVPWTPILFSAHTDTVTPCENIKPVVTKTKILSDGTTILGADDKAAIAAFLEAISQIKENNLQHGPIEFLFTCAEEIGLYGIKEFDLSLLNAKYAFVFDGGGEIGKVILKAPYQTTFNLIIKGKAAHAGIAPEKGVSAIRIASEIITKIPHGRIDHETTVNVGLISGGKATNIVAEETSIALEARSISREKLKSIEKKIENIANSIVDKNKAKIKIYKKLEYSGYAIKENDRIVRILNDALRKIQIKPVYESSGGGSDTNVINRSGIKAVNLSIGMRDVHTKKEYINIKDLVNGSKLVLSIIESV